MFYYSFKQDYANKQPLSFFINAKHKVSSVDKQINGKLFEIDRYYGIV